MQQFQPMYQPMYGGYQMPQQMPQYQPQVQPQQPVQAVGVPGRVVGNISEIKPDEVPQDGAVAWFPLSDGSGVVSKRLNGDWTVTTNVYVLQQQEKQQDPAEIMMGKLDQILDAVTPKAAKHATKEADNA